MDEDIKIFDLNKYKESRRKERDAKVFDPNKFRIKIEGDEEDITRLVERVIPENIEINTENCALLSGRTLEVEGTRTIGENLQATTSIGTVRKNQEDAFLLIEHPNIPGFKLMAVSDGMGGVNNGEIASHMVLDSIRKLFLSLKKEDYEDPARVEGRLTRLINVISKLLNELYDGAGCTLSCAICGKENTLITNIGDSRIYKYQAGDLTKMTVDQSLAQMKYTMRRN